MHGMQLGQLFRSHRNESPVFFIVPSIGSFASVVKNKVGMHSFACIQMTTSHIVSGRNKHMELKMHYVRERVKSGDIALNYVSTKDQLADILTKILPRPCFERNRDLLLQPTFKH